MAESSDNAGEAAPKPRRPVIDRQAAIDPPLPPSKPLQIFLLVALLITGAAYVQDRWLQLTSPTGPRVSKLHRLVESQSAYLAHISRGQAALKRGRIDEAVKEFRLALQMENWSEGHENLGRALLLKREPDAAFAQFRQGIAIDPRQTSLYLAWGDALAAQVRLAEAERVLRQGLKANPDSGPLHFALANVLQKSEPAAPVQERDTIAAEALRQYANASRNGVDSVDFWTRYGEMLNRQGRYEDAVSALQRAAKRGEATPDTCAQLASAQEHLGHYADAIGAYEKVLSLVPDDPQTLNSLALIYATATQPEARSSKMAVLLATRACDATTGQNASFLATLARAYAEDGDFESALQWEDKALHRAAQLNDRPLERELQSRRAAFEKHKAD